MTRIVWFYPNYSIKHNRTIARTALCESALCEDLLYKWNLHCFWVCIDEKLFEIDGALLNYWFSFWAKRPQKCRIFARKSLENFMLPLGTCAVQVLYEITYHMWWIWLVLARVWIFFMIYKLFSFISSCKYIFKVAEI